MIVSVGVLVLRVRHPELPRNFKIPWIWFVGPMGAISSLVLMCSLPFATWVRLVVWLVIGLTIYFTYSIKNSKLAQPQPNAVPNPSTGPKAG